VSSHEKIKRLRLLQKDIEHKQGKYSKIFQAIECFF